MPLNTIRALAQELFHQLTRERTIDAVTGFELGRLSAAITMLSGGPVLRDTNMRTRATDVERVVPITEAPAGGPGYRTTSPQRDSQGHFAAKAGGNGKRHRVERRPMRNPERVLTGLGGHEVVYNFARLDITERLTKHGAPKVTKVATRKELWDALKKQKREFKKAAKA